MGCHEGILIQYIYINVFSIYITFVFVHERIKDSLKKTESFSQNTTANINTFVDCAHFVGEYSRT